MGKRLSNGRLEHIPGQGGLGVSGVSSLDDVMAKLDAFIERSRREVESRPWLVVVLMHEYFRHLYPEDPYIPFGDAWDGPLQRVSSVIDKCLALYESGGFLGSYLGGNGRKLESVLSDRSRFQGRRRHNEGPTQKVYGALWDKFGQSVYCREAYEILKSRLKHSGFDLKTLTGKTVLDLGCGSGRFTIALSMTGAGRVVGYDLGAASIENARSVARKTGCGNVEFSVGSVLELPYAENSFDFVFCNGVLHHTGDWQRGLRELHRVLKPGGISFLYLYGDGGLFWHSRKKMPEVMKRIPQEYTLGILDMIGMPSNRFIFADNWYVPVEEHVSRESLETCFAVLGFKGYKKVVSGRSTDLDSMVASEDPQSREMWGEGEHRYLLRK